MKRPLAIYPVALWSWLVGVPCATDIAHTASAIVPPGRLAKEFTDPLIGCLVIFLFWHTFRLIQLKAFYRWLAVAIFTCSAADSIWRLIVNTPAASQPVFTALTFSGFAALNFLCVWYLTRIEFREFATAYVAAGKQKYRDRVRRIALLGIPGSETHSDLALPPPLPLQTAEDIRRRYLTHETSIKAIGSFYYLTAGILVVCAFVGSSIPQFGVSPQHFVVSLLLIGSAVLFFLTGRRFRALDPSMKIVGVVLSCIGLLEFPIGTLVHLYFLYLLLSKKVSFVFSEEYHGVISRTPHITYKVSKVILVLFYLILAVVLFCIACVVYYKTTAPSGG